VRPPVRPAAVPVRRLTPGDIPIGYGILRERLLVSANGKPFRTLVFAGCQGGEGCTRVVRDFAETLAASGLNVLLVDADLRTAGLTTSIVARGTDLVELVAEGRSLPAAEWGKGKLTVVPSPEAPHPDKDRFFRSPEFAAWLDAQRATYDYVLLDAPSLLHFADGNLMARLCDGVVIVVQAEVTTRESLVRAREQMERAGANLIGVVLNRVRNPVPVFLRPYISLE
jgi:capsular exopolysaccharide synthesis family protein